MSKFRDVNIDFDAKFIVSIHIHPHGLSQYNEFHHARDLTDRPPITSSD